MIRYMYILQSDYFFPFKFLYNTNLCMFTVEKLENTDNQKNNNKTTYFYRPETPTTILGYGFLTFFFHFTI